MHARYVKGDDLKKAVAALGKVDVVWAEMGNTSLVAARKSLRVGQCIC